MKKILPLILCLGLLLACKSNDPISGNDQINQWIYANMDYWYYWTDQLPGKGNTNQYPEDYYESLLYSGDRFSFIYENYEELVALLNGVSLESGFEFKLYYANDSGPNLIMQLVYIKEGAPADDLGLKRGDIIDQINGIQLTDTNYQSLLGQMNAAYSLTYRRYNNDAEVFENRGTLNLIPVVFAENPILLDSVYEIEGKKIGYFVYTFFSGGPTESSSEYDDEVDAVFENFKSNGIDELIVDLRFNGGGSVLSAINLASLIVDGATSTDVMLRRFYNDDIQEEIINTPQLGADFLKDEFLDKTQNVGSLLASGKVHFITSGRTASASELVINSLRPFMPIYTVGETTVGKDVGSITIADEGNSKNTWGLQPIIVKMVNNDNQDYPSGFVPNVEVLDNQLVLQPLGDINEPLLNAAMSAVGIGTAARLDIGSSLKRKPVFFSIDNKAWSQKMILEIPNLREPQFE
jgi:C-terminal processing protease CtpA/Prc